MRPGITVAIPSIPPRAHLLTRALRSVHAQTRAADAVSIAYDHHHEGAAITRQRALDAVATEWTAFLDDDDELLPQHLSRLEQFAAETGADYVFPWYTVVGGTDPMPQHFGKPYNSGSPEPRHTTIVHLVRTELARAAGFLRPSDGHGIDEYEPGEDYTYTLRCLAAGARIEHLPERTWLWHHDSANTSGRPDKW